MSMPKYLFSMNLTKITFTDMDDLKKFVEALNQSEGQRMGFKLTIHDVRKGKRVPIP